MPKIYSKRVGAEKPPKDAIYVGRPTKWGNPFAVGRDGDQEECVALYKEWINQPEQDWLVEAAQQELQGKDLVCWCVPQPCHAKVLMEVANGTQKEEHARSR